MTHSPTPYPPTQKQLALLRLLAAAQAAGQPVPSYWELSRDLSIARSGVHRLMTGLETRGWIERRRGSPRCVRLLHPVPGTLTVEAAFRAGHQAGVKGWPLPGALTAWRKARGVGTPPHIDPDKEIDATRRRAACGLIGPKEAAGIIERCILERRRAHPDHGLPSTEDVCGILKPAPGEGGDADPAPPPRLPGERRSPAAPKPATPVSQGRTPAGANAPPDSADALEDQQKGGA